MDLLSNPEIVWSHYQGGEEFDYPIDYAGTLLSAREDGHVDVLYRWAPNSYCHLHRHLCPTTSTVLAGEFHVITYEDGKEVGRKVRSAGDYVHNAAEEVHQEMGGPEGALVLFNLFAPNGKITQALAPDWSVIHTVTVQDIMEYGLGGSRV